MQVIHDMHFLYDVVYGGLRMNAMHAQATFGDKLGGGSSPVQLEDCNIEWVSNENAKTWVTSAKGVL